jgi:glycosyltransferase involved in cell wall biosynthesis
MQKHKKLLLIGGSKGNAHLRNFHGLISDLFDSILVVSNDTIDFAPCLTINFGLKNPFKFLKNVRALNAIIRKFKPDIIHVHQANSYALITILANTKRIPIILTTWGSDVLLLPKKGCFYRAMVRYVLKKASLITADASFMAEAIHELIGKKEVIIANFGVEFQKNNEVITRDFIIYSNRMHEPLYNIDQVIYQLKDFLLENSKWKLIIAAEGTQTPYLKKKVAEEFPKNTIEFVGFLSPEENILYYKKAMFYISIPKSDGTSISLLEAMAYGCLPITSDLPANKEWITTQENGIISHGNLTKDVEIALTLDRVAIQEKNKVIIENRATKETNKRLYSAIYDKLMGPLHYDKQ